MLIRRLGLKAKGVPNLTTHNMTVADDLCDRVAFIVDGMIKLIDSPRKLKIEKYIIFVKY